MVIARKTAHFIWGGPPLPDEYANNIEQFAQLNPGWATQIWDEDACREIIPASVQHLFDQAGQYVPEDSIWQLRSDIARLAILGKRGGLYIDTDFRWQRPIGELLVAPPTTIITVWEKEGHHVANGFIYSARPGHSIFRQCIRELPGRVHERKGQRANRITGPSGQWTSVARRRHDVKILPSKYLLPYAWHELSREHEEFPEAYGVHVWNHQKTIRGRR